MKQNFSKKVLSNGMTVLFEKRDLPLVCIGFGVKVGGINESFEEKGISHFIEHMLYKGTPSRNAKKIVCEIEKRGGVLNGFTDETITGFWCKLPSEHLNIGLNVLSDIVKNPLFDEKEIEKERQVIFEEIKMRKDMPQIYVVDSIQSCLYEGTLAKNLIGTFETMSSLKRKDLVKKFNETFVPENMILCVVGNANFEEVVDFAEKNFEKKTGQINEYSNELKNISKTESRSGLDQSHLIFAYHVPSAKDKKCYSAFVLSTLIAEGMSSRLFEEIREKRNLAYAVKGGTEMKKDYAFNWIYVGTSPENVDEVKKLILLEFEKVFNSLSEEEFEEVKQQIISNYHISFEDSNAQMLDLIFFELAGKAEDYYEFDKRIKEVKLEEVKELAKNIVDGKHSFFILNPVLE